MFTPMMPGTARTLAAAALDAYEAWVQSLGDAGRDLTAIQLSTLRWLLDL